MTGPRTRTLGAAAVVLLAVALLALAACSEDAEPSVVLPSSAFPGDTGAGAPIGATTAPATGPTAAIPTGPTGQPSGPLNGDGALSTGRAAVDVTGDVDASKTLPTLFAGSFAPPPGGMAVVWVAGGTDATTLGLGGLSFTGTQPTAPTLSLTLTVQAGEGIVSFVSTAGECSITIGRATASAMSGAFVCSNLSSPDGRVVDASGSFAARG
jgi:hypothetical protein